MNQVLTDIHQHLIWGMDDGANSRETMFSMLRELTAKALKQSWPHLMQNRGFSRLT